MPLAVMQGAILVNTLHDMYLKLTPWKDQQAIPGVPMPQPGVARAYKATLDNNRPWPLEWNKRDLLGASASSVQPARPAFDAQNRKIAQTRRERDDTEQPLTTSP